MRAFSFNLALLLSFAFGKAFAETHVPFPVDRKPLEKYPVLMAELKTIEAASKTQVLSKDMLKRVLEITETISGTEPEWVDGHWMVANAAFHLATAYNDEADRPYARSIFVRGQKSVELCLQKRPDHDICKLFLGATIAKIASIDGIFASLKKAKQVEELWLDVTKSKYNHAFTEASSLQGSARYGLGIFYRLVPDSILVKWLFDVKGDIEKSIAFHRNAIPFDPPHPCTEVMLAASLLCSTNGDFQKPNGLEGLKHLRDARQIVITSPSAQACWDDVPRLQANPELACGYETTRQQDTSEEEFKKQHSAHN